SKEKFAAAEQRLDAMLAMKVKLEADVERLEVRLEAARARESQDENCFDDQELGDLKEDFAKLEERISKMEIKSDLEAQYLPKTQETTSGKKATVSEDLLKEIDDHFKPSKNGQKVAADRE